MSGVYHRKTEKSNRQHKPFQPAPGSDFGKVEEVDAGTRGFLARFIFYNSTLALGIAAGYSLIYHIYAVLLAVWAVVGPIIGVVVAYYFGPTRNDTG